MKFTPQPAVNGRRGPRLFVSGSAGPFRGGDRREREREFGRSFPPPASPDPNRRRGEPGLESSHEEKTWRKTHDPLDYPHRRCSAWATSSVSSVGLHNLLDSCEVISMSSNFQGVVHFMHSKPEET